MSVDLETVPTPRGTDPPGGYYASELKKIHDSSRLVFPESVYEDEFGVQARGKRWSSVYTGDYIPLVEGNSMFCSMSPGKEEFVRGPKGKEFPRKMFMQWRVPSRLTENGDKSARETPADMFEQTEAPIGIPTPSTKPIRSYTLPEVNQSLAGTPAPASARGSAFPNSARGVPMSARGPMPGSRLAMVSPRKEQYVSQTARAPPPPKALQTQQLLANFQRQKPNPDVDRILKNMSENDKAVLSRVIKSLDKNTDTLKQLGPWIQQATPQERQAALNFFQSIVGNNLLGYNSPDKKQRALQALGLLERSNRSAVGLRSSTDDGESRLRHLRLLTPGTRNSKWMHQTWHHLPTHRDTDAVYNRSAIYTEPQKIQHRHWTIHPDWP